MTGYEFSGPENLGRGMGGGPGRRQTGFGSSHPISQTNLPACDDTLADASVSRHPVSVKVPDLDREGVIGEE